MEIETALISGACGFVGGFAGAATNYLVSRRQVSRSGARLLADLEILEKARALQLEPGLTAAIEQYVRRRVKWHTHMEEPTSSDDA